MVIVMKIKERIAKLIDVKSIMTIMLTIVFCVLSLLGVIKAEQFLTVFTVVVSFFFGVKSGRDNSRDEDKENRSE